MVPVGLAVVDNGVGSGVSVVRKVGIPIDVVTRSYYVQEKYDNVRLMR